MTVKAARYGRVARRFVGLYSALAVACLLISYPAFMGLAAEDRHPALAAVLVLFVGLLIVGAWLVLNSILVPLAGLRRFIRKMAAGDLGARVNLDAPDEFGDMALTLSQMAADWEQKAAQLESRNAELQRASDLKTSFLAKVSHELRTPLQSIIGFSAMLQDELHGPLTPEQRQTVDKVSRNAEGLLQQINDLLDISRIEAGRIDLTIANVNVAECLESAYAAVEPLLTSKGLQFHVDLPAEPLVVSGSFHRLRQVFVNLLSNAVKFTHSGEVGLSARAAEGRIEVRVRDTGVGIPAESLPHIFDEFRQADDSIRRQYGGSGLGLAIARSLVVLHHGSITVDSQPARGSTFTVTLPLSRIP